MNPCVPSCRCRRKILTGSYLTLSLRAWSTALAAGRTQMSAVWNRSSPGSRSSASSAFRKPSGTERAFVRTATPAIDDEKEVGHS